MSTFLTRLRKKGLVEAKTEGKGYIYFPAVTEAEYRQAEARSILDAIYDGSLKNFLAALYRNPEIAPDEIEELKQWLSEK